MNGMIIIGHGNNIKQTIRDIVENKSMDIQPIEVNTLIQQEEQKQQSMIQRLKDLEIEMLTKEKLLKQQNDQKTYTYRDINRKNRSKVQRTFDKATFQRNVGNKGFRKKKGKYYG